MNNSIFKILILITSATACVALVLLLSHTISSPTHNDFDNQYEQKLAEFIPSEDMSYEECESQYKRFISLTKIFEVNSQIDNNVLYAKRADYLKTFVPIVKRKIEEKLAQSWGQHDLEKFEALADNMKYIDAENKDINDFCTEIESVVDAYEKLSYFISKYDNWYPDGNYFDKVENMMILYNSCKGTRYINKCDKYEKLSQVPSKIAERLYSTLRRDMTALESYSSTPEYSYNSLKSSWKDEVLDPYHSLANGYSSIFSNGFDNLQREYARIIHNAVNYYKNNRR